MSVIKVKEKGILVVMSGPSAVGKDSICNELKKKHDNIWLSVSMTTREPREGEIDGIHYFFATKEEFEENIKQDKFYEYAIVHSNNYYGTLKDNIQDKLNDGIDVILNIDIQGALELNDKIKDALFIFVVPPSMKTLKKRLVGRKTESEEKVIERFKTAYKEINEVSKYNYVVVNDILDHAVDKVASIITAEKCRVDRIEEVTLHNEEELIHESLIN